MKLIHIPFQTALKLIGLEGEELQAFYPKKAKATGGSAAKDKFLAVENDFAKKISFSPVLVLCLSRENAIKKLLDILHEMLGEIKGADHVDLIPHGIYASSSFKLANLQRNILFGSNISIAVYNRIKNFHVINNLYSAFLIQLKL